METPRRAPQSRRTRRTVLTIALVSGNVGPVMTFPAVWRASDFEVDSTPATPRSIAQSGKRYPRITIATSVQAT